MKPVELAFSPVDNQRLANLCGALDENLRQIETALDVSIARRGERFAVTGKPAQARIAAQVLQSFYERARNELSLEDVQLGLIEAAGPRKTQAPEGSPTLVTRRPDLHVGESVAKSGAQLRLERSDVGGCGGAEHGGTLTRFYLPAVCRKFRTPGTECSPARRARQGTRWCRLTR